MTRSRPGPKVLLIRHPPVDTAYRGVCYGQSDVPLSPAGREACERIAEEVSQLPIAHVIHTGLQRTRLLAEAIERRTGVQPRREVVLRERDFGTWELRTWDAIYREQGEKITKMITDPHHFRPGGGETTDALAARVEQWSQQWTKSGIAVVVTHGGPIAALRGRQRSLPVYDWPSLIPACGEQLWYDPQNAGGWMHVSSDAPLASAEQETADAANACRLARRSRV